jgi:dTMP kinase
MLFNLDYHKFMKNSKGKLIVFEGIDGAGKATQVKLLANYFKKIKKPFALISFPQYEKSFFGKIVRWYLNGEFGNVNDVNGYLGALLYAGDRFEAKNFILKNLKQNKIVIADRYVASNIAHQGAKLPYKEIKNFIKWIFYLEYKIYQIPKENLTIFLDIGNKQASHLRKKRQSEKKIKADIHEKNSAYLIKVANLYKKLAKKDKNWIKINCITKTNNLKTPKQINKEIISALINRKIV